MPSMIRTARGPLSRRAGLFALLRGLFTRAEAQRQRQALLDLDAAILRDIGLTRDEALREGHRGFWDWDPVQRHRAGRLPE